MLPVSAWPPGPPGDALSPFGRPRDICVNGPNGFVIPAGAWVVATTSNRVMMFRPQVTPFNPPRSIGTGILPGQPDIPSPPPCGCSNVFIPKFLKFNDAVERQRAFTQRTGLPPLRPLAGRRPPNWYGWAFVDAPSSTLVQYNSSGLVIADGQNVVIQGSGLATITQAYSV